MSVMHPRDARDFLRKYGYFDKRPSVKFSHEMHKYALVHNGTEYSMERHIETNDQDGFDAFCVHAAAIVKQELDRLGIKQPS